MPCCWQRCCTTEGVCLGICRAMYIDMCADMCRDRHTQVLLSNLVTPRRHLNPVSKKLRIDMQMRWPWLCCSCGMCHMICGCMSARCKPKDLANLLLLCNLLGLTRSNLSRSNSEVFIPKLVSQPCGDVNVGVKYRVTQTRDANKTRCVRE